MARKIINAVAVIIGVTTGLAALFCTVIAGFMTIPHFRDGTGALTSAPGLMTLTFLVGLAFLGCLIASRAWLHLRRPDDGTTRDMIGTVIYLIVILGIVPPFKGESFLLPLIFAAYVLHRWLVWRVTARTSPPETTESNV